MHAGARPGARGRVISESHRFVFVHIPRTRGTQVSKYLEPFGVALEGRRHAASPYFKHARAVDIRRFLGDSFDEYFRFTIVRNPWDWVVSCFAFNRGLRHVGPTGVPQWARDMSFDVWLPWWLESTKPSPLAFIDGPGGELLVDHVYRFETVLQELPELLRRLGVPMREGVWLNPLLKSRRASEGYRDYYDARTRRLVERYFEGEIELFGYAF